MIGPVLLGKNLIDRAFEKEQDRDVTKRKGGTDGASHFEDEKIVHE